MIWSFRSRKRGPPVRPRIGGPGEVVILVDDRIDPRLVMYHEPASVHSEQYRGFRTNLRAMNPTDAPRTLLFTSAQSGEGKSVTVANLAAALAEAPQLKVCLVDSDLRAGHLHRLFGLPEAPGLTDVLLDGVPPQKALHATPLSNLSLVPVGRPTDAPGEVLASHYFQEFIAWLKRRHNYILFDSPPCLAVADACEVSKFIDGVVICVAIGETTKRDAEAALSQLEAAGANVIGSFVTGAVPDAEGEAPLAETDRPDELE